MMGEMSKMDGTIDQPRRRSLSAFFASGSRWAALARSSHVRLAAYYLALCWILRWALWIRFDTGGSIPPRWLPEIMLHGMGRDLVAVTVLLLPVSLFFLFAATGSPVGKLRRAGLGLVGFSWIYGVTYLAFVEYFYFEEFSARLNLVAVDYLLYPHEVLINLWESYPVAQVLAVNAIVSLAVLALLWSRLKGGLAVRRAPRHRLALILIHGMVAVAAVSVFADQRFDAWGNRVAEQLSENGVLTFYGALATNEIDYDASYLSGESQVMRRRVGAWLDREGARLEPDSPSLERRFEPTPGEPERAPNIVLVLEESFGAEFVGAYGDDRNLTPSFDALSKQGILFRNAYATGTRTVRGIEAILTSLPPIPTVSIVRRPGCEDVANLGKTLRERGYRTSFFYGGYSYFDNMDHFFSSNGFTVYDRSDIADPQFANIWGVSDEDLFRFTLDQLDAVTAAEETPFLAVVLTTSNHKPFTFPPGVPGVAESGGGRLAGVRYADHAIGRLAEEAEKRPWSRSTIFVIVADHGARVYGAAKIPLETYAVPLLFWWPGTLEPAVIETRMSHIDVAPTLLGLLGRPYNARFFGQNVLRPDTAKPPVLLFSHDHDIGLLRGDDFVVLGLQQQVSAYRVDLEKGSFEAVDPEKELVGLAVAYYKTAYDLFRQRAYQ